jgi:hypothetical protein
LRTARGRADGQWVFSDSFNATDQTMYVVLELPEPVGHTPFRVTIAPTGKPGRVLATKDFTWPVGRAVDAIEFSPQEIAAYIGPGSYTVNCYSLGQLTLQHVFLIQP